MSTALDPPSAAANCDTPLEGEAERVAQAPRVGLAARLVAGERVHRVGVGLGAATRAREVHPWVVGRDVAVAGHAQDLAVDDVLVLAVAVAAATGAAVVQL